MSLNPRVCKKNYKVHIPSIGEECEFWLITVTDEQSITNPDKDHAYLTDDGKLFVFNGDSLVRVNCDICFTQEEREKLEGIEENANNYELPIATYSRLGGVQIGYSENQRNYALKLDENNRAYVTVPKDDVEDIPIPLATDKQVGGLKIGYQDTGSFHGLQLDADGKGYVKVDPSETCATKQELDDAIANVQSQIDGLSEKVTEIEGKLSKSKQEAVEFYYNMQRDGKVYQTRFYKFDVNPTSDGTKMLANEGLVCEPSTDTVEGRDDYESIPLFKWVRCNYKREADGTPYPVAIEGDKNYKTDGDVDVGSMMMSFWYKVVENSDYIDYYISDSPNEALGLEPWVNCVRADGTLVPWNIYSCYFSGIAKDGNLRSQPNLKPENFQSYQNMMTNYPKKGEGYFGAGVDLETFQIIFLAIKYATKNSQTVFSGTTGYNFQYQASVQRSEKDTYFPVTQAQKNNIIIGSSVYVGYPSDNNGTPNYDRGVTTMREYANMAKVLRIEDDGDNARVYLDCEPFDTMPKTVGAISAQITISSMHWYSGTTDKVVGHYDGSIVSNTNSKYPYRVQGIEFAVGGYLLASDTVMDIQSDMSKNVYLLNKGAERSSNIETIKANSTLIGTVPAANGSNDYWIGDVGIKDGAWYPKSKGTSNTTGVADYIYFGGTATSGQREYCMGGDLWYGSVAGACCLSCWHWLSSAHWSFLAHD